jgi:hypothetical protein
MGKSVTEQRHPWNVRIDERSDRLVFRADGINTWWFIHGKDDVAEKTR